MAPRQPASSPRRSWRDSSIDANRTVRRSGSKVPVLSLLAAIVVGLVVWLGWLLWQPVKPEPPTYFVALTTGQCDLLSEPPVLFEQQTLAPLKPLDSSGGWFHENRSVGRAANREH